MPLPGTGTAIALTTLAAAVADGKQSSVSLASVSLTVGPFTNITAANPQWGLFIDSELMEVAVNPSGTIVGVTRGAQGTAATAHGNGQTVWAAPLQYLPKPAPAYGPQFPPRFTYQTVPIGSVAYASFGNNTTVVSGTVYFADLNITNGFASTGGAVLIGQTGGTNLGLVAIYDTYGNLVATSALAGATVGTDETIQKRAWSPGPVYLPPGHYYLAYQQNGATATLATVAASTFVDVLTGSVTGTFGTVPSSITIPTTFTANVGPIGYVY